MHLSRAVFSCITAAVSLAAGAHAQCDPLWLPEGEYPGIQPSADRTVSYWDPDGDGPARQAMVIAGTLAMAGDTRARGLVLWDGESWTPLYPPGLVGPVSTAVPYRGELLVAGQFIPPNGGTTSLLMAYDGTSWRTLVAANGSQQIIRRMSVFGDDLILAGYFQSMGAATCANVARWDGTACRAMGTGFAGTPPGGFGDGLYALHEFQGSLLALGSFTTADGAPASCIARWTGAGWAAFTSGTFNGGIYSAANHNDQLYIGGSFTTISGVPGFNKVARWDGTAFVITGGGITPNPSATSSLHSYAGNLYAAGFSTLYRLTEPTWSAIAPILSGGVSLTTDYDGEFYALGSFGYISDTSRGNPAIQGIARRTPAENWEPVARVFNDAVHTLMPRGDELLAAGRFTFVGQTPASGLARRDADGWHAVDGSFSGTFVTMIEHADGVLLGGAVNRVNGASCSNLALWNGSTMTPFTPGLSGPSSPIVRKLLRYQGRLYACGIFYIGSDTGLAYLENNQWVSMGVTGGVVYDMTIHNGELVIAGSFQHVRNDLPYRGVAAFNGTTWRALPFGTGTFVHGRAIASHNNDLFFIAATNTSQPMGSTYRWNGSAWVSDGVGNVRAFASYRDQLLALGVPIIGNNPPMCSLAAVRNGPGSWTTLPGFSVCSSDPAIAGVEHDNDFYVAGQFLSYSTEDLSPYIARWHNPDPYIREHPADVTAPVGGTAVLRVGGSAGDDGHPAWERNGVAVSDGPAGASPSGASVDGARTLVLTLTGVRTSDAGAYLCRITGPCGDISSLPATLAVPCPPDVNHDGTLNSQDFFDFLGAFFKGNADFNADKTTNSQDFFDFLAAFFAGC
jgi:hypothetical protein